MRNVIPFIPLASPRTLSAANRLKEGESEEIVSPNKKAFPYIDPNLEKPDEIDALGYGMERCLYEFNPELACLSPCLIHAAALTPAEALVALESVAAQPNRPSFPIDRHLGAFLTSRWKEASLMDLRDLEKPQREVKNLAALKVLADMQEHFDIHELPHLCQWMAELCAPMVTHYQSLKARAHVQEDIARAVSSGRLVKLLDAVSNGESLTKDKSDYQEAKTEILLIKSEIKEIEAQLRKLTHASFTRPTGAWRKVVHFWHCIRWANMARRGKIRMAHLHHRSEILLETWGSGILP